MARLNVDTKFSFIAFRSHCRKKNSLAWCSRQNLHFRDVKKIRRRKVYAKIISDDSRATLDPDHGIRIYFTPEYDITKNLVTLFTYQ